MSKDFKDIDNDFDETEESQHKDGFKKDKDLGLDEEIDESAIDEVFENNDEEDDGDEEDAELYDEDDDWDNGSDEEEDTY